jgi:protein-L-isoaspartate(D-aspartate) O-methyltransferase
VNVQTRQSTLDADGAANATMVGDGEPLPAMASLPYRRKPGANQPAGPQGRPAKSGSGPDLSARQAMLSSATSHAPWVAIGSGQTISQPYIVALMIEALELEGGERVLEIGAGSGYAAVLLGEIAREVYAIERIGRLAERAAINLRGAGCRNVRIKCADGTLGWSEVCPFDAILVSAGSPPVPPELKAQLKIGGRLVIPVGTTAHAQELIRIRRKSQTRRHGRSNRRCRP